MQHSCRRFRRQQQAVRAESHAAYASGVSGKCDVLLAGSQIEQFDFPVLATGGQRPAVGAEFQPQSPLRCSLEREHPFATSLGCSDSRVAPEIVFDPGLGSLFDVRVAGNVGRRFC
jgi:hypothetical protein